MEGNMCFHFADRFPLPSISEWMDIGLKFLKRRLRLAGNYYNDFFVVNEFLVDRIAQGNCTKSMQFKKKERKKITHAYA